MSRSLPRWASSPLRHPGRTMGSEVRQTADRLLHGRELALGDPPEAEDRLGRHLEELASTAEKLDVTGAIGEIGQGVDRFLNREIDDFQFVAEGLDACGVPALVLQPPHVPRTDLSKRVDPREVHAEIVDDRVVHRRPQPGDVQLGQMHPAIMPCQALERPTPLPEARRFLPRSSWACRDGFAWDKWPPHGAPSRLALRRRCPSPPRSSQGGP